MSSEAAHPLATAHIPHFVAAADGSDYLFSAMVVFAIVLIALLGVGYFTLHALPEKMAHKNQHSQFQLVGILAILALFTHNNLFWFAAILLAGLRLPDLMTPIKSITASLAALAKSGEALSQKPANDHGPETAKVPEPDPAIAAQAATSDQEGAAKNV